MPSAIVIIGIGNEYRGDDAAGLAVARRVRGTESAPPGLIVIEASGEGAALMDAWNGADAVILIDAVMSGAAAGTIHRFDARARPVPAGFLHYSTHAFSVAEAIELARVLNRLPPRLLLYGIEGKSFETGIGLSEEVELAVGEAAARVISEIHSIHRAAIRRD
ncbi:MAG: hydrogenase maturation protease [Blastocatellia bacterium]